MTKQTGDTALMITPDIGSDLLRRDPAAIERFLERLDAALSASQVKTDQKEDETITIRIVVKRSAYRAAEDWGA